MADTITCPECDAEVESLDDLEKHEEVHEVAGDGDSIELFGTRDLYLCKGCRKPLGVGRSRRSE